MEKPLKPDESDCCNSGCNPCILDVYEEQVKKYNDYLKKVGTNIHSSALYESCLFPTSYSIFKLVNIEQHSGNTYFYKFKFSDFHKRELTASKLQSRVLKYNPGQHFLLKGHGESGQDEFTRAYTPIPHGDDEQLTFTIIVKLYKYGLMCGFLKKLKIGADTLWRGPYCDFIVDYTFKHILFVAQGTGIAPIYSVICDILNNEQCDTFLHLCFCCKSIEDILLRDDLYQLSSYWNFKYEVFLSNIYSNSNNKYNEVINLKRLEQNDIENYLANIVTNSLQVLICGSEQFSDCIKTYVTNSNIDSQNIYCF